MFNLKTLETSIEELNVTGIEINYYFTCKTKLWFFTHGIQLEGESDRVSLGKVVHQVHFRGERMKEGVFNKVRVDWIRSKRNFELHELKLTDKNKNATTWQMKYYLYYFKHEFGIDARGFIHYYNNKTVEEVFLSRDDIITLHKIISRIKKIKESKTPPKPVRKRICNKCAYYELCWV